MFNTQIMNQQPSSQETRREFIKTSAAAALAAPFVLASSARGQDSPGETLRIGLIGCGGRGAGAPAQKPSADKNSPLTGLGGGFPEDPHPPFKNPQKNHPQKGKGQPHHFF